MLVRDLRRIYLEFFQSKGHVLHPSASLVPYDVTGKLDESLLFTGAGMVQFKPYFRGIAKPPSTRLANCQKVVRTGDIEDVGDPTHFTFFEMLGNFSFGDYFKAEAIAYSWEFLTSPQWLALDPNRLAFTVFETDDEAYKEWAKWLSAAGIDPSVRIFRLGEESNFWPAGSFSNGPPGPCGPNTEIFYWTIDSEPPPLAAMDRAPEGEGAGGGGQYGSADFVRDEAAGKWLEIWNDVFIQFEWKGRLRNPQRPADGYERESIDPLPFQSVDTGMGLERTAAALSGIADLYQVDSVWPIIEKIVETRNSMGESGAELSRRQFGKSPDYERISYGLNRESDRALRIIADHVRTATFCIAEGILPSNVGRGYVLRRLIRRAAMEGMRRLGFKAPFLHAIHDGVATALGDHYPEIVERKEAIESTLFAEGQLFHRTLSEGFAEFMGVLRIDQTRRLRQDSKLAEGPVGKEPASLRFDRSNYIEEPRDYGRWLESRGESWVFPGHLAFKLYDTFGFPLEVTQELAAEAGIGVDLEGYEIALKEAQERSRSASGMDVVYGEREELMLLTSKKANTETAFLGYDTTEGPAELVQISPRFGPDGLTTGEFQVCLDQTPFYAESGGQVGDTGNISCPDFEFEVTNTWKELGLIWHDCRLVGIDEGAGWFVPAAPSQAPGTTQPGPSWVGLAPDQIIKICQSGFFFKPVLAKVDAKRRAMIVRNHTATHLLHAALRQVLGKHVTQAGSLVAPDHLRFDFTHGKAMTEEELRRVEEIVNREVLASIPVQIHQDVPIGEAKTKGAMALFGEKYGDRVRMVEVPGFSIELCGGCHVRQTSEIGLFKILNESSAASGVRRIEAITGEGAYEWALSQEGLIKEAAEKLKTHPRDLGKAIDRLQDQLREERKKVDKLRTQAPDRSQAKIEQVGPIELAIEIMEDTELKEATLRADRLVEGQPRRVALVALTSNGSGNFIVKAGPEALSAGAHAGNLVREIAKMAGGGGGGRPDFATAGAKDIGQMERAILAAKDILAAQLKR